MWAWAGLVGALVVVGGCAKPGVVSGGGVTGERPLLMWEVRREGIETSHLFGTCHVGVSADELLPMARRGALSEADWFVMEMDPGSLVKWMMEGRGAAAEGERLPDLVGEQRWGEALDRLGAREVEEQVATMHPFFALQMLASHVQANERGAKAGGTMLQGSVDLELRTLAMLEGVPNAWLETIDAQLDVFSALTAEDYAEALDSLGEPGGAAKAQGVQMALADRCRTGDVAGLEEVIAQSESENRDFAYKLLGERNRRWVDVLEEQFAKGSSFVAAGVAHFVGEGSVIASLRERGYTVNRLSGRTVPAVPLVRATVDDVGEWGARHLPAAVCSAELPLQKCLEFSDSECAQAVQVAARECVDVVEGVVGRRVRAEDWPAARSAVGRCVGAMVMLPRLDEVRTDLPECAAMAGGG